MLSSCAIILVLILLDFSFSVSRIYMKFERGRTRVAVDYGPRIIGLAHSDLFGSVHPYGTLRNNGNLTNICYEIVDFACRNGATEIVTGIPLDFDGVMSHKVKNFNGRLCLNFSSVLSSVAREVRGEKLRTVLFDERYTSKEARARIKSDRTKASVDAMSAACLLERYLEDCGEGAIDALPCSFPPPLDIAYFDYKIVKNHIRSLHFGDGITLPSPAIPPSPSKISNLDEVKAVTPVVEEGGTSEMDQDMAEYYMIRTQRRKKGTLKGKKT